MNRKTLQNQRSRLPTSLPVKTKRISNKAMVPKEIQAESKMAMQNGLGSALGFTGDFFTDTLGIGGSQLSQVDTLFKNNRWYLISNMRQLLSELYIEHGLIQTIVNVPVDDGLRGGVEITTKQLEEEQIQELNTSLERDDDLGSIAQALKWNRLFGGAGVLIMTDQDPMAPLDIKSLDKDSALEFRAVDMWELFWDKQNTEGYDPEIQTQEFEYYNYYAKKLHKSRVMRMKGLIAPSFIRPRLRGWGFSVVEHLVRSMNQYLKTNDLTFEVLDEFKLDVFKIKNLTNTLLSPQGEQQVQRRIRLANWEKNYQNAIIMDSEDDYDHKQLTFQGIAEVMSGIKLHIAADMRMPMSKIFGISATGFNSGEDDIEVYNSMVESEVRNKAKYDILRVIEIKCQKMFGFIPDDISIKFKPLRMLSAEQEENVKTQKFNRLLSARTANEITTYEFRTACNRDNLLTVQLDLNGDEFNPEDRSIASLMDRDPYDTKDVQDPGANRADTRKPRAWDTKTPINPQKNSMAFDKASYKADGGDAWIDVRRLKLIKELKVKDEPLWERAKQESQNLYKEINWAFVAWLYKKLGGKF